MSTGTQNAPQALPLAANLPRRARPRRNWYLLVGALLLLAFGGLALFGEALAPHAADHQDLLGVLLPPSEEYPFGTDLLGRDLFSRVIIGTRYTLTVALVSVLIAAVMGIALGAVAGFYGGQADAALTTVIDLMLTVPLLILALIIASVMGAGLTGLIVATAIAFTPPLARLIRGRVMELREEEFIQAALVIGVARPVIILRHVLPNAITVICVETTLLAGQAVLISTALGFLGLGVPPPAPEWGTLLGQSREYLEIAPHLILAPGLAISLLVLGFNLLGDGLRDLFDPHSD